MFIKFNTKTTPRIIFGVVIIGMLIWGLCNPIIFQVNGSLISSLITLFYVYLTYEILRTTLAAKQLPYIDPLFVISSKLDENFLKTYPQLKQTERVKQLIEEAKKPQQISKNYIFIKVENIGEATGIEVKLDLKYSKKNLGDITEQHRNFEFGTIRNAITSMEFVDVFESPGRDDSIKITECCTEYNTVNSRHISDSAIKKEHARNVSFVINNNDEISVSFHNLSN